MLWPFHDTTSLSVQQETSFRFLPSVVTMKLSGLVFVAFFASALANGDVALVDGTISSNSRLGQKIMSKARQLNNNNNNNNYYISWMSDYSIKFDGCAAVPEFQKDEGLRANLLAKFKLCPSDQCGSCPNAGEYIVDLREFVETYQEAQKEANQYACQTQQETCEYQCQNGQYEYQNANYNNDDGNNGQNNQNNNQNNGDYCKYQCMTDAGMSFCEEDGGDRDMKEFAECRAMENGNNKNNNNNNYNYYDSSSYQVYYTGAYCTSSGVYAGVFTDSSCTKSAPSGTYEKYNYGYTLPSSPLVKAGCTSCLYSNNNNNNNNGGNNNNNNNNGNSVSQFCSELYQRSGKCEKNVKGTSYQDTSGCELIHDILPKLSSAFSTINRGGPGAAKVLAWVFGVSCAFMGVYIYLLHKKVIRQKVNLAALGFGAGATTESGVAA